MTEEALMAHYRASRAFSTASSLAEGSEFVARHSPGMKLMGSVLLGTIAVTAYVTSLLGKRDLALKEEATQRVLADLAESTKRALALKEESTKQALTDLAESTKRELALKEESTRRALALMEEAAQRALALKEESTQRALADLEERRQREVDEQRARVETLERVFGISYHSDWTGLREKINALKPTEPNKAVSGTGNGNGTGSAPGVGNGASAGPAQP